jgi:hypothetical protein
MRRRVLVVAACLAALLTGNAAANALNKCIDAQGKVTYSNLPCKNARETRRVEIDPPPVPDPVRTPPKPAAVQPPPARTPAPPAVPRADREAPVLKLETRTTGKPEPGATRKCNTLADKLGRVFDKMDAARRKGYTQEQMDDWNRQIKELERQKQQAGCF